MSRGYHSLLFFAIAFFDELIFGVQAAAWPDIRQDLHLSYLQIGLLSAIPAFMSSLSEPMIGLAGGAGNRRKLVVGGGVLYVVSLCAISASRAYLPLLLSLVCLFPASGAFVSLSQATLMDTEPDKRERNMAKWAFAGSAGNVLGPLLFSLVALLHGGWRGAYLMLGVLGSVLVVASRRYPAIPGASTQGAASEIRETVRALRSPSVIRWLVLLELADLMLDILFGYIALYVVDTGASSAAAGTAVAVWTAIGLLGDFLLIALLRKVPGLTYLRASAAVELVLYPMLLLAGRIELKILILSAVGFCNAGWYSILKARLYEEIPNRSNLVMTLTAISGLIASGMTVGLGWFADRFGIAAMMWLLILGPMALLTGIPRRRTTG